MIVPRTLKIVATLTLITITGQSFGAYPEATLLNQERKQQRIRRISSRAVVSVMQEGLWRATAAALFFMDLVFPIVTRTMASFFTCRDLKTGTTGMQCDSPESCGDPDYQGYWLEADYSPSRSCRTLFLL